MQNVFVQIGVGIIPAAIAFLMIGLIAKKHKLRNFISAAVFTAAAAAIALTGLFSGKNEQRPIKAADKLSLVYLVAEEGSPEVALTLLQDLRVNYKSEYALAGARFAVQNKDYAVAKALYLKSADEFPDSSSELEAVQNALGVESGYYGLNAETDMTELYLRRGETLSEAEKKIADAIEDCVPETDDNSFKRLAKYIVYAETTHGDYVNGNIFDETEAKKQLKKLKDLLEENPSFLEITQARLARLKLQILCEDYKDIAASVSEDSDYDELLIVSKLYLNKYVKQSNFSGDFSKQSMEKYKTVYDKLSEIYNNSYTDLDREERNEMKSQLAALKTVIKNPALGKIEEGLLEYANDEYSIDASKAYLQMAKIEHSLDSVYTSLTNRSKPKQNRTTLNCPEKRTGCFGISCSNTAPSF